MAGSSSSDGDAESGSGSDSDRAYVAAAAGRSSRAALRAHNLQRFLGSNEAGFQQVAVRGYSFGSGVDSEPRAFKRIDSDSMSIAATSHSRSSTWDSNASSEYPPSLVSSTTVRTVSSTSTADVNSFLRSISLDDDEGVVDRLPAQPQLHIRCPYLCLNCSFASSDLRIWDTHCRSHFRGNLPRSAKCPFGRCQWSSSAATGQEAWDNRLRHLDEHSPIEREVIPVRADKPLIDHLSHQHGVTPISEGNVLLRVDVPLVRLLRQHIVDDQTEPKLVHRQRDHIVVSAAQCPSTRCIGIQHSYSQPKLLRPYHEFDTLVIQDALRTAERQMTVH